MIGWTPLRIKWRARPSPAPSSSARRNRKVSLKGRLLKITYSVKGFFVRHFTYLRFPDLSPTETISLANTFLDTSFSSNKMICHFTCKLFLEQLLVLEVRMISQVRLQSWDPDILRRSKVKCRGSGRKAQGSPAKINIWINKYKICMYNLTFLSPIVFLFDCLPPNCNWCRMFFRVSATFLPQYLALLSMFLTPAWPSTAILHKYSNQLKGPVQPLVISYEQLQREANEVASWFLDRIIFCNPDYIYYFTFWLR